MPARQHDLAITARAFNAGGVRVGSAPGIESSAWLPPAPAGVAAMQ
jgi:hypothetical protein